MIDRIADHDRRCDLQSWNGTSWASFPASWHVDAYRNANFGGNVCAFTADTPWVGAACNDVMSSFRIRAP